MPIVISPNKLYAKNDDGTGYLSANVISDQTTEEQCERIEDFGDDEVARIQSKADEVTAQLANAAEVEDMFAGTFNTSTAYTTGQYVIQTITSGGSSVNKLFRFTADHAAGAWIGTDAVEVKICNDVSDLKSALSENIQSTYLTPTYNRTEQGVTCKVENDALTVYGTCSTQRRFLYLNGQDAVKNSSNAFSKTLDAGTYLIESDFSGTSTTYRFDATYSTFANGFILVNQTEKVKTITFTAPVMIGFSSATNKNYGTSESPTIISFSAKRITAKDVVARDTLDDALSLIFEEEDYTYSESNYIKWTITSAGVWTSWISSGLGRGCLIPLSKAMKKITVTGESTNSSIIAFLKSFNPINNSDPVDFSDDYQSRIVISANEERTFTIPSDAQYFYALAIDSSGNNHLPDTVITKFEYTSVSVYQNTYSNSNTNNINTTVQQNTYNVTASPSITTDDLYYLAPDPNGADQTTAIATMLSTNGVCRLGSGTYYVGNLDMPVNSSIIGNGASTVVRLLDSVTDGYAIKMNTRCTVKDLLISGAESYSAHVVTAINPGTRIGILWTGEGITTDSLIPSYGMISNVRFERFNGSGLKCTHTGEKYRHKLEVSDCYFMWCDAGVNIAYESEFHQFVNCTFGACYYGAINNGGNNYFCNCNFESNVKQFVIDNSSGTLPNPAHSGITCCDFSHAMGFDEQDNPKSNTGTQIEIIGITNGFNFVHCNFGFGKIILTDAGGILFDACTWSGASYNNIYITRGTGIFFSSCLFGSQYSFNKVENDTVKFLNCWTKDGLTEVKIT